MLFTYKHNYFLNCADDILYLHSHRDVSRTGSEYGEIWDKIITDWETVDSHTNIILMPHENGERMTDIDAMVTGACIWGCAVDRRLADSGKNVLVLEKQAVGGGNVRFEINVAAQLITPNL